MTEAAARPPEARLGLRLPLHLLHRLPPAAREALPVALLLALLLLHLAAGYPSWELPAAAALTTALVLPLAWRNRAPYPVFGTVAAAALLQWQAGIQLPADVALLVALYAVAARTGRRGTPVACAVVAGGALAACLSWSTDGPYAVPLAALTAAAATAAALGAHARTTRAHLAVLARQQEQRERLAAAEERARIAGEVHDIVGHHLSVMVALTDAAAHIRHRAPEQAATALRQAAETGRQALTDLRRPLGPPRTGEPAPEREPLPGIAELAPLADRMRAAGLPVRLDVHGAPEHLPATVQLTVHRLVQEALANTLRHAPAGTRAEVRIHCTPTAVTVDVTDDNPTPPPPAATGSGQGIPGMRERAAAHGGTLSAGPLPDGGWAVRTRLRLGGGPTSP
ncbi:sensor histidine kinase [Kitasatospora cineracea]|uniref:sensor histidine kinase n=1 Tax=Kitasatospora cineracea TaxID=88074 RepID=UPI00380080B6